MVIKVFADFFVRNDDCYHDDLCDIEKLQPGNMSLNIDLYCQYCVPRFFSKEIEVCIYKDDPDKECPEVM